MNWIRKHRLSPGTAFGFAALIIALGGVALAAIPDSNGTIHGCYQKNNGNLRVVESAGDCRSSEAVISWNQTGPQGPPGPSGTDQKVASSLIHLSTGETKTVLSRGPFTFSADCVDLGSSEFSINFRVTSSEDHWSTGGDATRPAGQIQGLGGFSSKREDLSGSSPVTLLTPTIGPISVQHIIGVHVYGSDCVAGVVTVG